MQSEVSQLRVLLFAIYLAYPIIVLQRLFFEAFLNPFSSIGDFFLIVSLAAGVLVAFTLTHFFGILALACVTTSDLAFGLPIFIFAPHIAVALAFSEGTVALRPYQNVASLVLRGKEENVSSQLGICLSNLRRKLVLIFVPLFLIAFGYGFLPAATPSNIGVEGLAVYGVMVLVVFSIIALYLGTSSKTN